MLQIVFYKNKNIESLQKKNNLQKNLQKIIGRFLIYRKNIGDFYRISYNIGKLQEFLQKGKFIENVNPRIPWSLLIIGLIKLTIFVISNYFLNLCLFRNHSIKQIFFSMIKFYYTYLYFIQKLQYIKLKKVTR